jgi:hypothetical protein
LYILGFDFHFAPSRLNHESKRAGDISLLEFALQDCNVENYGS